LEASGQLALKKASYNRREALAENEAYVLRLMEADEYAYKGADLAIMFTNCRIRGPQGQLNPTGELWVSALKGCFQFRGLDQEEQSQIQSGATTATSKSELE
jgi:hypothetical protein